MRELDVHTVLRLLDLQLLVIVGQWLSLRNNQIDVVLEICLGVLPAVLIGHDMCGV